MKTKEAPPLYEMVLRAVKSEMMKNMWVRDKTIVLALKDVQSLYAKYWRKTGNFPTNQIAASLITDVINEKTKLTKKCRNSEKIELEEQICVLNDYITEKFEYVKIDFEHLDPCKTNVKWELYHNPNNIVITDKRQLRSIR